MGSIIRPYRPVSVYRDFDSCIEERYGKSICSGGKDWCAGNEILLSVQVAVGWLGRQVDIDSVSDSDIYGVGYCCRVFLMQF